MTCLATSPSRGTASGSSASRFHKLRKLHIHYTVMLKPHLNSGQFDALGALISSCPSLVKLELTVVPDVAAMILNISAPRLGDMVIEARSTDWMVEFQRPLADISSAKLRLPLFRYVQEGGSKLMHLFQSISQVEKLELLDGSPLDDFQDILLLKVPVTFMKLQYLSTDADLGCASHIVFILHFIRSCPNIRELEIKVKPIIYHVFLVSAFGTASLICTLNTIACLKAWFSTSFRSKSRILGYAWIWGCTTAPACYEIDQYIHVWQ